MATPRQAAAVRATLSQTAGAGNASAGSSPSKQKGGNGLGRKQESKKLVDWDDVEAKAKREAMWLLRWRKEQQEAEANTPCKAQPPKKRQRKTPPEKQKDGQQTENDPTPPTLGHRRTASTTMRKPEFKTPGSVSIKAELTEEKDAASPTGGGAGAMAGARTARAQTKTEAESAIESTCDGRCSKDAPSACPALSLPSPSHSCSSGSDGTAFSTCAPTSLTSAHSPVMPCSPMRHGAPHQQTNIASGGKSGTGSWGGEQGICLLAAAAVGRALEEAQLEERLRNGAKPKTERMSALLDESPALAPSFCLPPSKRRKGRSSSPKARAREGGGGKSPKVPGAKSSKCPKSTAGTERGGAATGNAKPARRRSRKKLPWRPTELRFIVETPSSPGPTAYSPETSGSSVETPPEEARTAQRESMIEMGRCADGWRLSVPFLPGFAVSKKEVGVEGKADGEAKKAFSRKGNCDLVFAAGRSAGDDTADGPAIGGPVTAADGRPKTSLFVSAVGSSPLGGGSGKSDDGAQNEGCGAGVHAPPVTVAEGEGCNAQASAELTASVGGACSTPSHVAVGDDSGGLNWSSSRLSDAGRTDNTNGIIADTTAKGMLGVGNVASTPSLGVTSTEERGRDGGDDVRNNDDGYDIDEDDNEYDAGDDYYGEDGYDGEAEGSVDYPHGSIYGRQDAAGWTTGPFSLRWLPADGLAALQAAGAACGMDVDMLEAAAVAAGEAPCERPLEEVIVRGRGRGTKRKVVEVRKVRKKRKTRAKRETHVLVSESEGEEPGGTSSTWRDLEETAREEAKALLMYKNCGMFEAEDDENQHWVRRSVRAAGASQLDSPHVVKLLAQIRANDPEVEVLKLHHYLGPDVNTGVIDAVLEAISVNTNCQALYIQNFNEGFRDEQVRKLAAVLRQGKIWCLNAGENYKVSLDTWWAFVEEIKSTSVTHAYLSEHVITPELKNAMRDAIRHNRAKHTRHKSYSNLDVIRRCTNMWWNPINSRFLQAELKLMDVDYETISCVPSPVSTGKRLPCSLHDKAEGRKSPPSPLTLPDAQPVSPRRSHQTAGGVRSPRRYY